MKLLFSKMCSLERRYYVPASLKDGELCFVMCKSDSLLGSRQHRNVMAQKGHCEP